MSDSDTTSAMQSFLDRALPRIRRFMLVLGSVGIVICWLFFRWAPTAGFAAGAVISYINQHWLERGIEALGERIASQQSRERGGIIVVRAAFRYVLVACGAYVIFNVSHAALYGFLAGVCLPFAAIVCEVAVEALILLRRDSPWSG